MIIPNLIPFASVTVGSLAGLNGRTHCPAGVGAGVGGLTGVGSVGGGGHVTTLGSSS